MLRHLDLVHKRVHHLCHYGKHSPQSAQSLEQSVVAGRDHLLGLHVPVSLCKTKCVHLFQPAVHNALQEDYGNQDSSHFLHLPESLESSCEEWGPLLRKRYRTRRANLGWNCSELCDLANIGNAYDG